MEKSEAVTKPVDSEQAEKYRKVTIAAFIGVALLYWMGLYLYVPTLPVYVQSRVDNLAAVGTVLSMYGLWQLIMRLPTGIAADFLGRRKPFIIVGLLLVGGGAWVLGSASSTAGLLAGRSLTGMAAATWVPLTVSFAALFKPKEAIRATAILTLTSTAGRILATSMTGFINTASGGYQLAFQLAAGVAWIAAFCMLFLPETARFTGERATGSKIIGMFARRSVILPALMNAVIQYGDWAATFSFIPILVKRLGGGDVVQSSLASYNTFILLLGNLFAASLANRFGKRKLVLASIGFLALGTGAAAFATSIPFLFFSQTLVGISVGIGYPVLMGSSIEQVDEKERTIAMGLHQSVYATGMFAGPWMSGIIASWLGIPAMFTLTGIAILIVGLFLVRQLRPND